MNERRKKPGFASETAWKAHLVERSRDASIHRATSSGWEPVVEPKPDVSQAGMPKILANLARLTGFEPPSKDSS